MITTKEEKRKEFKKLNNGNELLNKVANILFNINNDIFWNDVSGFTLLYIMEKIAKEKTFGSEDKWLIKLDGTIKRLTITKYFEI